MTVVSTAMRPHLARLPNDTALFMLAVVGLTYMINAMDRIVFPTLLHNVNEHFGFTLQQGGFLATVFTLGLGLSGLPTGYCLDRFSRKSVILIGITLYSVLTILSAFSIGFYDMTLYRVLSGVGEGMQNAAIYTAVGAYFFSRRALGMGALNLAYGIGSFIGPRLGAAILDATGGDWRMPLICYGIIGLVGVIGAALVVAPSFTEQVTEGSADRASGNSDAHLPDGLFHRNVVICALCAMGGGVAGFGFLGLYPTYLRSELHFTVNEAGFAASMYGLGALFGVCAGLLADRISQRWINIVTLVVLAVDGYALFNWATSTLSQNFFSFLEGAAASGFLYINTYSLIQRSVRTSYVGRASGVLVTCVYLPASVSGYTFATLQGWYGWGNAALLQLTFFLAIPIVALFFFDPSKVMRPLRAAKRDAVVS